MTGRQIDGAPVYEYVRVPGAPPVSVLRFSSDQLSAAHATPDRAHAHDFLVLAYFEHGAGSFHVGDRQWSPETGDAFLIAPGEVVRLGHPDHLAAAVGWCVFFPPELIRSDALGGSLGWRPHPPLFPVVARAAGRVQRLPLPPAEPAAW